MDLRLLVEQAVEDPVDVLGQRALLRAGRLGELLVEGCQRLPDLDRDVADGLELLRGQLAVVADGGVPNRLAEFLRVLGRDLGRHLDEQAADELARLLERRQALLLRPVGEAARPEVVVLVEVPFLALGEVLPAPLQPVLERDQLLVAVDHDLLGLGLDLVLETVQVLLTRLGVDRGDDRRCEVENLLQLAGSDVEQVADPARHALEEPDVRDRRGQVDVAHPLTADLLPSHLDAAALADDPLVADALVLAAVALPVLRRTEDALAEKAVALGLERAVVDGLGLRYLARRPVANLLARREPDSDRVEIIYVDQSAYSSTSAGSVSGPACSSASSVATASGSTSTSARSPSASSAGTFRSPSWSTRSWPSSTSSAVGGRGVVRSEPGVRSMPSSSAARSSSSSSSRTSTSLPSSERTWTSSASDCISFSSTLKDSGIDGSAMFSPLTIAS